MKGGQQAQSSPAPSGGGGKAPPLPPGFKSDKT